MRDALESVTDGDNIMIARGRGRGRGRGTRGQRAGRSRGRGTRGHRAGRGRAGRGRGTRGRGRGQPEPSELPDLSIPSNLNIEGKIIFLLILD